MAKEPVSVVDEHYEGYYLTDDVLENEPVSLEITKVYNPNKEQRYDD